MATQSGTILLSAKGSTCQIVHHSGNLHYILSCVAACGITQALTTSSSTAHTHNLQDPSETEHISSEDAACDVSAPFQVLASPAGTCTALIMHHKGLRAVPEQLQPLILAAPRCGLTQTDLIEAMPALLDGVDAKYMCALLRSQFQSIHTTEALILRNTLPVD